MLKEQNNPLECPQEKPLDATPEFPLVFQSFYTENLFFILYGHKVREYNLETKSMKDLEKKSYYMQCLAELESFRF
jgi:hypothetical protein